jgi:hypothetical protein
VTPTEQAAADVLRSFLILTWWAEKPGVSITFIDDQRSGSEVRELFNLRTQARSALAALDAEPDYRERMARLYRGEDK